MSGYAPPTALGWALLAGALAVSLVLGGVVIRRAPLVVARGLAWAFLVGGVAFGAWSLDGEPSGNRMLLLCATTFFAMKVVVASESRADGRALPTAARWPAFVLLWPGMRPWAFVSGRGGARPRGGRMVVEGLASIGVGSACVLFARRVGLGAFGGVPAFVLLLAGLGLIFHFGTFRVLAGAWRRLGAAVTPLFHAPWRSRSLAEFWSKRWNLAFSEMAQIAMARPLAPRAGTRAAAYAGFLLSGLLHEVAISVPVRAGFGGPLLYFAIQGGLVLLEPRLGIGTPRRSGALSRAWTWTALLAPIPLLFHRPFVEGCVLPLLR